MLLTSVHKRSCFPGDPSSDIYCTSLEGAQTGRRMGSSTRSLQAGCGAARPPGRRRAEPTSHSLACCWVTPRAGAQRDVKPLFWKGIIQGGLDPAMNLMRLLCPTTSAGHGGGPVQLWLLHSTSRPHWGVLVERGAHTWVQDLLLQCCHPASGTSCHKQPGLRLQLAFYQGHPPQGAAPHHPRVPQQEQGSPAAPTRLSRGSTGGTGARSGRFPAPLGAVLPAGLALPGLSP